MTQATDQQLLEGRHAIAVALSGIVGRQLSAWTVDRLSSRTRDPLPVKGWPGRRWAYVGELRAWWERQRLDESRARGSDGG